MDFRKLIRPICCLMKFAHDFFTSSLVFSPSPSAPLEGTSVANRFDLPANRGNMAGTRRNGFLLSAVYDVPVGQNRKFLSHMNWISDLALGGWSVSTVFGTPDHI